MMTITRKSCFAFLISCTSLFLNAQEKAELIQTIRSQKVYAISKDAQKSFEFVLEKDVNYLITVEQKGIDLTIILKYKNGTKIQEVDSPNGAYGPENITFKPSFTDYFLLEIIPYQNGELANGRFKISITEQPIVDLKKPIVELLSPKAMHEDLTVFRKIREQANSGFDRYRTKKQLDSIYDWAFSQIRTQKNSLDFYKIIAVLTDFEGSLHNSTKLPHPLHDYLPKDKGYFPLPMKLIDGKAIANNENAVIPVGSEILTINGKDIHRIMTECFKYCTTDGYNTTQKKLWSMERDFATNLILEEGIAESFNVTYKLPKSDKILRKVLQSESLRASRNEKLHSAPYDSLLHYRKQKKYSLQILNNDTALLNIRIFNIGGNAQDVEHLRYVQFLDSIFSKFKTENTIKNLIIDIRNNPGGTDPNETKTFTYLAEKPFYENKSAYINFVKIPLAAYYNYDSTDPENQELGRLQFEKELSEEFTTEKEGKYYQNENKNPVWMPDSNAFKGNMYVLINPNVASAASNFAALVKGNTNAVFIGEETTGGYYGHNGHTPMEYVLPNSKIVTRFSIVNLNQYVPARKDQPVGHGVLPDYEVMQSFEDFMSNTDTQLNFALRLIKHNGKRN